MAVVGGPAWVLSLSGCSVLLGITGLDNSAEVCDQIEKTAEDIVAVAVLAATNPFAIDLYADRISDQVDGLAKVRPTNPELRTALLEANTEMGNLVAIITGEKSGATVVDFAQSLASTQLAVSDLSAVCSEVRK
jgi:hypothetical protein